MLDNEKAPQPKLEGGTHDQYEHLNTSMFDGEAAKQAIQDEFAPRVEQMRQKVEFWKERIAKWRSKAGPDAEMQKEFYRHHPAFGDMCAVLSGIFLICEPDEIEDWTIDILSKITRDADGQLRFDGKNKRGLDALASYMERVARIAVDQGNIGTTVLTSQNAELSHALALILWSEEWPYEVPLVVGIREAA